MEGNANDAAQANDKGTVKIVYNVSPDEWSTNDPDYPS